MMLAAGCGTTAGRLRFVSSFATQASWSLVVDDRARGAELLIDGRLRDDACDRVRSTIRCELRGLWPGGHTLEVRLPGAVMKRTVLIGHPWPADAARLVFVRATNKDEARQAAEAGADVVIADGDVEDVVAAAHQGGARVAIVADVASVERMSADVVIDAAGGALPADVVARFPEARALPSPARATSLPDAAAAIAEGRAVEVQANAFALLRARRRHAALRSGAAKALAGDGGRRAWELRAASDSVIVAVNDSDGAWAIATSFHPPLDLLGGSASDDKVIVRAHDVGVIIAGHAQSSTPDVTKF
jgi:hypothetical protein